MEKHILKSVSTHCRKGIRGHRVREKHPSMQEALKMKRGIKETGIDVTKANLIEPLSLGLHSEKLSLVLNS